jgi:predicted dehydrogenase
MQTSVIRSAVIGAGLLGMRHAEYLAGRQNAELIAVADVRSAVAEKAAHETGARPYTSYAEMLDKEKLDLVLVETPDGLHREPAIACCQAGVRNLVIQKPLSTTIDDAKVILDAAKASGTRIFVWYENRAFGSDMATQYAIRSGLIGTVIYGDCDTDNNILTPLIMWGERSRDWVSGSSPANFLASHTIDRLYWYLTPAHVDRVFALAVQEVLGYTPDLYDVFLYFDNGVKVRVKVGWSHRIEGKIESAEVFNGTAGQVYNHRHPRFNMQPGWRVNVGSQFSYEDLRFHQNILRQRGLGSRIVRSDPLTTGWEQGGLLALEIPAAEAPKHELLQFILDGIQEDTLTPRSWQAWQGDTPLVTGEIGLENVRVIDALERSAREGHPVEIVRD